MLRRESSSALRTYALFNAEHIIEQPGVLRVSQERGHPLSASVAQIVSQRCPGIYCGRAKETTIPATKSDSQASDRQHVSRLVSLTNSLEPHVDSSLRQ